MEGLVWMTNLLLLVSLFLYPVQSSGDSDRLCLLGFKGAIIFDPNNSLSNWVPTVSLCKWRGVTCSPLLQRVVAVNLSGMSLEGAISPLIGNLSALESLSLSRNALHGRIPSEIGRLSNVKTLNLERNQLEGNIPASLSGCRSLVLLALTYNRLQGTIPAELGSLPVLEILYLGGNFLTGKIPSSLGNISALTDLELAANNLIGPIPAEIGMLTHLQRLTVFTNNLSGTIPSSIGNLSGLTYLHLSTNNFTDPIPSELGRLKKLNTLYIWENRLTGPIPTSLQNCTALVDLALYQNRLSGHIPKDLGAKLTKLRSIYLWGNELSGSIPKSIGNCSKLAHLNLYMNHLSGTVPIEFGKLLFLQRFIISFNDLVSENSSSFTFLTALTNCSYLEWIEVSFNHLTGVISPNFGYLSSKLSVLLLDNNKISGIIPQEITNLTNLTRLDLSNNLLSGSIPAGINRFSRIERLDLGGNGLEGSVPVEIGQLRSLGCLCLSQNKLTGKIPNSLGELQQLRRIFLHHNHFSGEIPASLQRCPNLELLDLSHNDLRGNIPGEVLTSLKNVQFYLNLSWNFFQGPLPKEISRVVSARAIDISGNLLEGEIPGVLANCIALEYLNLSRNALAGPIPDALGKLPNLQQIDLSSNFLSGAIPTSLTKMNALHYINFSFNNLTGSVQEGMIPNSTVVALLMGNPGLCGPKQYLLPACPRQRQGKHWLLTIIMVSLTGVIAFMLCSLLICVVCKKKVSDQQIDLSNIIFGRMGYPKFSYRDLVIATNGFNETNFLGNGSFGSVYKGILRDGKAVAIKVLNVHNEEGEKSFQSECKILGRIRHRNLIRILSACVHPDFRGLILHFASNGSLEKHLYSDNSELDLSKCLNIAIDVAHGMEYLHHDCFDQVVHCDLKPSNVLLDADMTALVADFGICRLTNFTNSMDSLHTTFSLRGSIGYIAPEYGLGGRVSPKGDVYSFGVLVLEMVTRKRPADSMFFEDLNLPKWVMLAFPNRLVDIVYSRLLSNVHMEKIKHLLSFVNVGLLCTKESPQERPTMRDVVRVLEGIRTAFIRCGATPSNSETGTRELVHNLKASATVEMVSESQS